MRKLLLLLSISGYMSCGVVRNIGANSISLSVTNAGIPSEYNFSMIPEINIPEDGVISIVFP